MMCGVNTFATVIFELALCGERTRCKPTIYVPYIARERYGVLGFEIRRARAVRYGV